MFIHTDAKEELAELDDVEADDIADAVGQTADRSLSRGDVKKMHAGCQTDVFRLRLGNVRVFYLSHRDQRIILGASQRKDAYEDGFQTTVERRAEEFSPTSLAQPPDTKPGSLA